ncbi:MAG TPA: DUF4959 domain-containing protein, partial [Sphingobacterium sp.]|nr:DUF4959 domain-containing protein [Sphingobacterium sp.]
MKNLFRLLFISLFFATSCGEEVFQSLTDDSAPGQVSVIRTENGPGTARVYYNLPASESLLYIEATHQDKDETYTTKVSSYKNYIDLEGFSESRPYEIKLYSVSRGLNKSEPVVVQVHPETPPYLVTYNQTTVIPDFGGLNVGFDNPTGANLVVYVEKKNEAGEWIALDAFYSKELSMVFPIRDQPPVA